MENHPNLQFFPVGKESHLAPLVRHYFHEMITDVYGSQDQVLEKIFLGQDRVCEILIDVEYDQPLGLLVYKTTPINSTFELKTLFVINPEKHSRKKIASRLLRHAAKQASDASAQNMSVSVCSSRPETLAFFLKNGFKVSQTINNCYVKDIDEFFLHHSNVRQLLNISLTPQQELTQFIPQQDFTLSLKQSQLIRSYFNGITTPLIEECLRFNMHTHTPFPSEKYLCLFLSPLFDKEHFVGYVASAINHHGERHILGCLPQAHLSAHFWTTLFLTWKQASIQEFFIISYPNTISLPNTIMTIYPQAKLIPNGKQQLWEKNQFSPTCFSIQFLTLAQETFPC